MEDSRCAVVSGCAVFCVRAILLDLKSQISNFTVHCEKISKQLYGWIESLKNSEIAGQRRLDDKARSRYANKKERDEFMEELRRVTAKPEKEL